MADDAANVLAWILERTLRLLHPVMPFVTEEIWQRFGIGETIVRAAWPEADEFAELQSRGANVEAVWPFVEEFVTTVRRLRSEHGIPHKTKLQVHLVADETQHPLVDDTLGGFEPEVVRLAGISGITPSPPDEVHGSTRVMVQGAMVLVDLKDLVDVDAERDKLEKNLEQAEKELERVRAKLANPRFREKAPQQVVDGEKLKIGRFEHEVQTLREQLAELG